VPTTIRLSIDVCTDPAAAFDAFVEELARWAGDDPPHLFEPGPEGQFGDGGRVTAWERGRLLRIEWPPTEWDQQPRTAEIRFEPAGTSTRITLEHAGFGRPIEEFSGGEAMGSAELVGWFVDAAAGPSLAAASTSGLGDWLVNRFARRPAGARARTTYANPTEHRPGFAATLQGLSLGAEDHLLELGCGGGAFMQDALETGCNAVALDHSEEMVRLTERQNARAVAEGRLEVVHADAALLPFDDATFTAVAMTHMFFFLPDPAAVLAESARVLRPGGRLAVFTTSKELRGTPAAPEPMASRSRFYEDDELEQLARDAGFGEAEVTRAGYGAQLLVAHKADM
jgi:SAM-dependent methyltransferase